MRETTWERIGQDVSKCNNIDSVLESSGLNYDVIKMPLQISDGQPVPNRFVTVRPAEDGLKMYDVVSDKFELIQNRDAFDFVNYMGDELTFEKAGETAGGMIYIIGRLPEVNILGDAFVPHVIFRNGFTGKITTTAAICPLRIVCQNQFNFAFKDAENSVSVRHVSNAEAKLAEAKETLRMSADYMSKVNEIAERYAGTKMSKRQVEMLMNTMFPLAQDDENPFRAKTLLDARTAFINAYEADDNANFRGTAWGLINAYTDYITHKEVKEDKFESRFVRTTFKPSMNRILDVIQAVA